jgi:hypothetical protein
VKGQQIDRFARRGAERFPGFIRRYAPFEFNSPLIGMSNSGQLLNPE